MKKPILIALGSICVVLGALGVIVPLLPTVPFLLVAAWCYAGSSARLHHWLLHQRVLGPHLRRYQERHAISRAVRRGCLMMLWVSLGISAMLVPNLHVRVVLMIVGIAVSVHLLMLRVE